MAVSLEARVPFLDYRLVEMAASIPDDLKTRGGVAKYILRQAMRDLLPQEIVTRGKHAFDLPVNEWLHGHLRPMLEELPRHRLFRETDFFDREHVESLVKEHCSGQRQHGSGLWSLLTLAEWYSQYVDKGSDG